MKRSLVAIASMTSAMLAAPLAQAQAQAPQFGDKGQFIIGGDRLMPLLAYSQFSRDEASPGGTTTSHSGDNTTLGLFYGSTLDLNNQGDVGTDFPSSAFFTVPRVGLDYVLAPNVTIGGDVVVFFTLGGGHQTQTNFQNGTSMLSEQGSQSMTVFGIAPRAGYIMKLSDSFSLWLRGGVSFYNGTLRTSGNAGTLESDSQHQFVIDLEPQLVYTPIPHVGFTAALDGDFSPSFLGGYTHQDVEINESVSKSSEVVFIGATLGMIAYF